MFEFIYKLFVRRLENLRMSGHERKMIILYDSSGILFWETQLIRYCIKKEMTLSNRFGAVPEQFYCSIPFLEASV